MHTAHMCAVYMCMLCMCMCTYVHAPVPVHIHQEHLEALERKQKLAATYVPQVDDWLLGHGDTPTLSRPLDAGDTALSAGGVALSGSSSAVLTSDSVHSNVTLSPGVLAPVPVGALTTGIEHEAMKRLVDSLTSLPESLAPHRVVAALYKERSKMMERDSIE
mgnify:CR=1 FL=1